MSASGAEATPMSGSHEHNLRPRGGNGHAITRISSLRPNGSPPPCTRHDDNSQQQQTQQHHSREDQVLTYSGDDDSSVGENSNAHASDRNSIMSPPIVSSNCNTATDNNIPVPTTTNTNPTSHLHQKNGCSNHSSYAPCEEDGSNHRNHNRKSTSPDDEHEFVASARDTAPLRPIHRKDPSNIQDGNKTQDVLQHQNKQNDSAYDVEVNGDRDCQVVAGPSTIVRNIRNVDGHSDSHRGIAPGPAVPHRKRSHVDAPSNTKDQDLPRRSSSIDSSNLEFLATSALNAASSVGNTTPSVQTPIIPLLPRPIPDAPPLPPPPPPPSSTAPPTSPPLFPSFVPTMPPSPVLLKAFTFTEAEDNALIDFWFNNFETFTRSSKLSFARFATAEMNTMFAFKGSGRMETHEKQVHNKISYLIRRYERLLSKYANLRDGYQIEEAAFNEDVRRMIVPRFKDINSEFHAFSKMYEFFSRRRYDPKCHPSQGFYEQPRFAGGDWKWKGYGPRSSENYKQSAQSFGPRSSGNKTQSRGLIQGDLSVNQHRHSVGEVIGAGAGVMGSGMKRKRNDNKGDGGQQKKAFNRSSPGSSLDIHNPAKRVCATDNGLTVLNQNAQNGENQGQKNHRDRQRNTGSSNNQMPSDEMGAAVLPTSLLKACADQGEEDSHREAMEEEGCRESSQCEQEHRTTQVQNVVITGLGQEESGRLSTSRSGYGYGSGVGRPSPVVVHPAVAAVAGMSSLRNTATPQLTDVGAVVNPSSGNCAHPVNHHHHRPHPQRRPTELRTSFQQQYSNYQPVEGGLPDVQEPPPYRSYSRPVASTAAAANRHGNMEQEQLKLAPLLVDRGTGLHNNNGNRSGNNKVYSNGEHVQSQMQDVKDPQSSNVGSPGDEHVQQSGIVHSPPPPPPPTPDVRLGGGIIARHMPYRPGSSTKDRRPFCNTDDAGEESGHGHLDQINDNHYGNNNNHNRSAAPRQPSLAAAADFAPQAVSPDRATSTPATAAPNDDPARQNSVPPHLTAVAPDHTSAPTSTNYIGNKRSNGHGYNRSDAHRTSSDDVGGRGGGNASNDANHFEGTPPHGGNNNDGSDDGGDEDNTITAVVNENPLLLKKEELDIRRAELEVRKKELRSNEAKGLRDCARLYIDLNMRGAAAECVKKVMELIDANTKSLNSE